MHASLFVVIFSFLTFSSLATQSQISNFKQSEHLELNPKKISLLLWNIKKAEAGEKWQNDYDKLATSHDLVAVQEALLKPGRKSMMSGEHPLHQEMAVSFLKKDKSATGVATSSIVKPTSVKSIPSPDREPVLNTPKMSILTTYKLEGHNKELLLVNTHAINFVTNVKFERQMADLATYIKKHNGPVVWVGDFNTWSETRLKILNRVIEGLGMKPVRFDNDERSTFLAGHKVDHIFLRGLATSKAEVYSSISSSDHRPISVNLYLDTDYSTKGNKNANAELKTETNEIIKFLNQLDWTFALTPPFCN